MASSQECETDRDPRRTGLVATGVETIIDIVKSDADDTARADGRRQTAASTTITGAIHLIP